MPAASGFDNIEFFEMDAEALRFDEESFDAVTNAYGLMFCPDLQRAAGEMHRVLKPGGHLALVTWDDPSKSPFFTVTRGLAETFLPLRASDPAALGPFRLASSGQLESLLSASGFSDVRVESCPMTCECESVAEYCQIFTDLAWKSRIASLSEAATARFRDAIAEAHSRIWTEAACAWWPPPYVLRVESSLRSRARSCRVRLRATIPGKKKS